MPALFVPTIAPIHGSLRPAAARLTAHLPRSVFSSPPCTFEQSFIANGLAKKRVHLPGKTLPNVLCNLSEDDNPDAKTLPTSPPNIIPLIAYAIYMGRIFVFSPFEHNFGDDAIEALRLSFDFGYINSVLFPNVLFPLPLPQLEAIFHIVVSWAILLLPFCALDVTSPKTKPRATPFLISGLFITNIVYLPFLILRHSPPDDDSAPPVRKKLSDRFIKFIRFTESKSIPVFSLVLFCISIPWAFLAAGSETVGIHDRLVEFVNVTFNKDILSYSFVVDCVFFSLFQSALVREDADSTAREWSSTQIRRRATSAAYIPYFGLAFYLLQRAEYGHINWSLLGDDCE